MKNIRTVSAYRFSKRTDMCDFYAKRGEPQSWGDFIVDVSLILLLGYDDTGKTFCRIKCPINPLPIIGWWQAPSITDVIKLLESQGWSQTTEKPFPAYLLN